MSVSAEDWKTSGKRIKMKKIWSSVHVWEKEGLELIHVAASLSFGHTRFYCKNKKSFFFSFSVLILLQHLIHFHSTLSFVKTQERTLKHFVVLFNTLSTFCHKKIFISLQIFFKEWAPMQLKLRK